MFTLEFNSDLNVRLGKYFQDLGIFIFEFVCISNVFNVKGQVYVVVVVVVNQTASFSLLLIFFNKKTK
jgi:hypothetical protein